MKKVYKIFLSILVCSFFVLNLSCISLYSKDNIDLVKLKKKEEERRKKLKKPKFTVNNNNINRIKVSNKSYSFIQMEPVEGEEQDKQGKKEPKGKIGKKVPKDPEKTREYWQNLKNKLEHDLNELKKKVRNDQLRLNKMYSDYYSMSLPFQRINIKDQIDKFSGLLEKNKLMLKNLQKEMDSLADKARKAGVPPGWVR